MGGSKQSWLCRESDDEQHKSSSGHRGWGQVENGSCMVLTRLDTTWEALGSTEIGPNKHCEVTPLAAQWERERGL